MPSGGDWFAARPRASPGTSATPNSRAAPADWPDSYGGNFSAPTASLREVGGFAADAERDRGHRARLPPLPGRLPAALPAAGRRRPRGRKAAAAADRRRRALRRLLRRVRRARPGRPAAAARLVPRADPARGGAAAARCSPSASLPGALAALGALIPGAGRKQVWFGFVNRYAFWRGARAGMSRRRWLQTTRGVPVLMYHAFSEERRGRPLRDLAARLRPPDCDC